MDPILDKIFRDIQEKRGESQPTDLVIGTENRWFHRHHERKSLVEHEDDVLLYDEKREMSVRGKQAWL